MTLPWTGLTVRGTGLPQLVVNIDSPVTTFDVFAAAGSPLFAANVVINVNAKVNGGSPTSAALNCKNFVDGCILRINNATGNSIVAAGGDGGDGGDAEAGSSGAGNPGFGGGVGRDAIEADQNVQIIIDNGGGGGASIRAGGGGGGGGGGAWTNPNAATGGGGGGGVGDPPGSGGAAGTCSFGGGGGSCTAGDAGLAGDSVEPVGTPGTGGAGGNNTGSPPATGGDGGDGGDWAVIGDDGLNVGGQGGVPGKAVRNPNGTTTFTNAGSVSGVVDNQV